MRQNIYATLSDDKSTTVHHTSSRRGMVEDITLRVNTDLFGECKINVILTKECAEDGIPPTVYVYYPRGWSVVSVEKKVCTMYI